MKIILDIIALGWVIYVLYWFIIYPLFKAGQVIHNEAQKHAGFPSNITPMPNTSYYCFKITKKNGKTISGFDTDLNAVNLLLEFPDFQSWKRSGIGTTNDTGDIIPFMKKGETCHI